MSMLRKIMVLFRKDLILMRRNYVWTIFELVIPIIIIGGLIYLITKISGHSISNEAIFNSFAIRGNSKDIGETSPSPAMNWCGKKDLSIAFTIDKRDGNLPDETISRLLENITKGYEDARNFNFVKFDTVQQMTESLVNDIDNTTCTFKRFVLGIHFKSMISTHLDYDLYSRNLESDNWHFRTLWEYPYGPIPRLNVDIPREPPYYSRGIITFQAAIDSQWSLMFNEERILDELMFRALPVPSYKSNPIDEFISFFPIIWAFCTFTIVLNVARTIVAENLAIRPLLSAMGLPSFAFFLSHILTAFLKFLLIFIVCIIPLSLSMKFVDPIVLSLALIFYGLGIIVAAALLSTLFNDTSSAIKGLFFIWPILLYLTHKFEPSSSSIFLSFLYCLNVNGAFSKAIEAISSSMKRERRITIGSMFHDSTIEFSFGWALVLMIVDVVLMFALLIFVDYVKRKGSLSAIFQKKPKTSFDETDGRRAGMGNLETENLLEGANEVDGARDRAFADVIVEKLHKVYSTGEHAVNGLSMKIVKGQCTILLGHNGAGKSSTFSCLAGITRPTSGELSICGTSPEQARDQIGLCPQTNPLFDRLTVDEHLWLVHSLKAAKTPLGPERDELLKDVNLDFKRGERAENLSGGMKRKLCVCMALIGRSEVVFLDEPTAGMDPAARTDVQALLEREKKNRSILLTTHYMDEAERLGDWILIMSKGKLVASGTTSFLKKKFGTGYVLTTVFDEKSKQDDRVSESLVRVCNLYAHGAQAGKRHGKQFEIVLPEESKKHFAKLFRSIEKIQENRINEIENLPKGVREELEGVKISNVGLSLNTLEQVFINVEECVDAVAGKSLKPTAKNFDRLLTDGMRIDSGFQKKMFQFEAIFRKKTLYFLRNYGNLCFQIIVPLLMLVPMGLLSGIRIESDTDRIFDVSQYQPFRVLWQDPDMRQSESVWLLPYLQRFDMIMEKRPETENQSAIVREMIGELPALTVGFAPIASKKTILFNNRAYHILPTLLNVISNARLPEGHRITTGIRLFSEEPESESLFDSHAINILLAPVITFVFSMVVSSFVIFLVDERSIMFAHQQFLTGISPVVFYLVAMFWDLLLYILICGIFSAVFFYFKWFEEHFLVLFLFWIIFFVACVPFVYAVSLLFVSSSKANMLLLLWLALFTFIIWGAIMAMMFVLKMIKLITSGLLVLLQIVLPSYAFGSSVLKISLAAKTMSNAQLLEWDETGRSLACMLVFGAISCVLFLVLQNKMLQYKLFNLFNRRKSAVATMGEEMTNLPKCDELDIEKDKVMKGDVMDCVLVVNGLQKRYGAYKALNGLYMTVRKNECFGLLGVNGAGKTTTFNILTGLSFSSSGFASLAGENVEHKSRLGYCPQFDALLPELTGRECLEIMARMHGYIDYRLRAATILDCVGMVAHADKQVRFYSGGQKRKISIGLSLMAPETLVILDEPTAGIDPKSRRDILELLMWYKEHSQTSILLTSHSMDECEALCTRIGVLNKGKLMAIGTSQDLKSLYGNSYMMTLTLANPSQRDTVVKEVLARIENSVLKTPATNNTVNLVFELPKNANDKWSEKFKFVKELAESLNVKDYLLTQSSLEDTFLRLSGS